MKPQLDANAEIISSGLVSNTKIVNGSQNSNSGLVSLLARYCE